MTLSIMQISEINCTLTRVNGNESGRLFLLAPHPYFFGIVRDVFEIISWTFVGKKHISISVWKLWYSVLVWNRICLQITFSVYLIMSVSYFNLFLDWVLVLSVRPKLLMKKSMNTLVVQLMPAALTSCGQIMSEDFS